jgi:hypothetical protein
MRALRLWGFVPAPVTRTLVMIYRPTFLAAVLAARRPTSRKMVVVVGADHVAMLDLLDEHRLITLRDGLDLVTFRLV